MRLLIVVTAVLVILHGLVHLMGTAAYLKLAQVPQIPYKTTVLGGRLDLGAVGTAVYGVLWGVAALGLAAAGIGFLAGSDWARALLLGMTLLSLALTVLDWKVAFAGAVIDIVILLVLLVGPRLALLAR